MAYGILKCDTITFTDGGVDKSVSISGLVQNPTFSGNITVTGTVSGNTIQGQTVSGVTVTGTTSNFASGVFTTQISGATVTGNVGSFTTITGGTVTLTSGVFGAGTASAPSITFTGDLNTGIYSPGADQVAVATGGSGRLFVDANGNLLVGANNNSGGLGERLSINGAGLVTQSAAATNRGLFGTFSGSTQIIGAFDNIPLEFRTNNTERLRITSDGKVGLGTSSPSDRLHVIGGGIFSTATTAANLLQVRNSDFTSFGYFGVEGPTGGVTVTGSLANATLISSGATGTPLQFGTAGTIRATLDSSGRLGVGTSSPSDVLHVEGTIRTSSSSSNAQFANNFLRSNQAGTFYFDQNSGSQDFAFRVSNVSNLDTTAMTIKSSGRVGIGTSSPSSLLHLSVATAASDGTKGVRISNPAGTTAIFECGSSNDSYVGTTSASDFSIRTNNTSRIYVTNGGSVGIGTTAPSYALHVSGTGQVSSRTFATDSTGDASFFVQNDGNGLCGPLVYGSTKTAYGALASNETAFYSNRSTTIMADGGSTVIKFATGGNTERARIDSSGSLLVGTTTLGNNRNGVSISPTSVTIANNSGSAVLLLSALNTNVASNIGGIITFNAVYRNSDSDSTQIAYIKGLRENATENAWASYLSFETSPGTTVPVERMRITSAGNVGIGTQSPGSTLDVNGDCAVANTKAYQVKDSGGTTRYAMYMSGSLSPSAGNDLFIGNTLANSLILYTNSTERARIDSSGRLLVGTSSSSAEAKFIVQGGATASGGVMNIQRNATTASTGSTIGSIHFTNSSNNVGATVIAEGDGTWSAGTSHPTRLVFSVTADGASTPTEAVRISQNKVTQFANDIIPGADNVYQVGQSGRRWSVVYAGTGSINTSDATLKCDVADLDAAELAVAIAIKGLIKKFKFVDAVELKGDNARIHVGVIAQEVKAAFEAEGLDAHRYGLFCEDELEDGTKRLGIRYDELLAFVIAAL